MIPAIETAHNARSYSPLPRIPVQPTPATPCTGAELETVLRLARGIGRRIESVVIGSSADEVSRANAARIAEAWAERGGVVLATVTWPDTAASWLRQARRFTAPDPGAWIVTSTLPGWIGMGRRLVYSTTWDPHRTIATAGLADPVLIGAGGIGTFDSLRGAHTDGRTWEIAAAALVECGQPGGPQ
jgi:hypothetical protein